MVPPAPSGWVNPIPDWKVKIRGLERLEEPHVTIVGPGNLTYRLGLRTWAFLDDRPPSRDVPKELITAILAHEREWKQHWNEMYPKALIGLP